MPIYAAAGIPEVWVVNLVENRIEVHSTPGLRRYQEVRALHRGDRLAATAIPGLLLEVDSILD